MDIAPQRLPGWVTRFGEHHDGTPAALMVDGVLTLTAPDGERAECHAPPGATPLPHGHPLEHAVEDFATEAGRSRRIGVLLVRRGGFAVGVADGESLVSSKVDSRYVQSRTAAGGWSQHRFARRRENQAKAAAGETAEVCVRLLLPEARNLAAVVTGGDRQSVDAVLSDARLERLRSLVAERFLTVPDPKLVVLRAAAGQARAVRIKVVPAAG